MVSSQGETERGSFVENERGVQDDGRRCSKRHGDERGDTTETRGTKDPRRDIVFDYRTLITVRIQYVLASSARG